MRAPGSASPYFPQSTPSAHQRGQGRRQSALENARRSVHPHAARGGMRTRGTENRGAAGAHAAGRASSQGRKFPPGELSSPPPPPLRPRRLRCPARARASSPAVVRRRSNACAPPARPAALVPPRAFSSASRFFVEAFASYGLQDYFLIPPPFLPFCPRPRPFPRSTPLHGWIRNLVEFRIETVHSMRGTFLRRAAPSPSLTDRSPSRARESLADGLREREGEEGLRGPRKK